MGKNRKQAGATAVKRPSRFQKRMATDGWFLLVGLLPILLIYPFVQKYFVKGVMIGSIKG